MEPAVHVRVGEGAHELGLALVLGRVRLKLPAVLPALLHLDLDLAQQVPLRRGLKTARARAPWAGHARIRAGGRGAGRWWEAAAKQHGAVPARSTKRRASPPPRSGPRPGRHSRHHSPWALRRCPLQPWCVAQRSGPKRESVTREPYFSHTPRCWRPAAPVRARRAYAAAVWRLRACCPGSSPPGCRTSATTWAPCASGRRCSARKAPS